MNVCTDTATIKVDYSFLAKKRFVVEESSSWEYYGQPQELYIVIKAMAANSSLKPGQFVRKFSSGVFFSTKEYMVSNEYKIFLVKQINFSHYKDCLLKV